MTLFFSILITLILALITALLYKIILEAQLFLHQKRSIAKIEWTLLELKFPRAVLQTPLAMEQFFIQLHTLRNSPTTKYETYIEGQVTLWWSLEIARFENKIHFYIRTPKKHRNLTEMALYAQYPDAELIEADDYIKKFPETTLEFYESGEGFFGSEFILDKADYFPIKTYKAFGAAVQAGEKMAMAIDPFSSLIESIAGLQKNENFLMQILIEPASDDWKKKAEEELTTEKKKKGVVWPEKTMEFTKNLIKAPIEYPQWAEKKEEKEEKKEEKAKPEKLKERGFNSLIRFAYFAPNALLDINWAIRGPRGALNQYSHEDNSFKHNFAAWPIIPWHQFKFPYFFIPERSEARKQRLWYTFRNRLLPERLSWGKFFTSHFFNKNDKSKAIILVCSELATIFHVPGELVLTSPHIQLAESKKMGPPAGLPIFEE